MIKCRLLKQPDNHSIEQKTCSVSPHWSSAFNMFIVSSRIVFELRSCCLETLMTPFLCDCCCCSWFHLHINKSNWFPSSEIVNYCFLKEGTVCIPFLWHHSLFLYALICWSTEITQALCCYRDAYVKCTMYLCVWLLVGKCNGSASDVNICFFDLV